MQLSTARTVAAEIQGIIDPYCERVMVVGSVRRACPMVNDIDFVVIPGNQGRLALALRALGKEVRSGPTVYSCRYQGVHKVDFFMATEDTWWPTVLIRTGSKEHNARLAWLAKRRGWHLYADGRGLVDAAGARIVSDSEASFFKALQIPYVGPANR